MTDKLRAIYCSLCMASHPSNNFVGIGDQRGTNGKVVGHCMNCKTCGTTILFLKKKNNDYEEIVNGMEKNLTKRETLILGE